MEVMLLSFLMPAMRKIWSLGPFEEATLGSVVFLVRLLLQPGYPTLDYILILKLN